MRHRKFGKRLNMGPAHRKAMIRNMLTSLIEHEEIQTTDTRCKILKREFDRLVTLGKKDSVHARRLAATKVFGKDAVQKLFNELAPRYQGRPGGYSRIYKIGQRRGDGAPVSLIRLLPEGEAVPNRSRKTSAEPEAPKVEAAPVVEETPEVAVEETPEAEKAE
jgi:large subunit ribosomal protein L17